MRVVFSEFSGSNPNVGWWLFLVLLISVGTVTVRGTERTERPGVIRSSYFMERACIRIPDRELSVPLCESDACNAARDEFLKKIQLTLSSDISSRIGIEDMMILPEFCDGDDAVAVSVRMDTFTVHIIDSRKFTVIVEDYLIENEALSEINTVVNAIYALIIYREEGPPELKEIDILPFIRYPYTASGAITSDGDLCSQAEFWYTPEFTVFSWLYISPEFTDPECTPAGKAIPVL